MEGRCRLIGETHRMFSKLHDWLRRNPRPPLDDALAEEIARELMAPVLPPPLPQTQTVFSSREFRASDIAARTRAIPWFINCGKPLNVDLAMSVRRPKDWTQAIEWCRSEQWNDANLEASNDLSGWLHMHAHQDYQRWNEVIGQFRQTLLLPVIHP